MTSPQRQRLLNKIRRERALRRRHSLVNPAAFRHWVQIPSSQGTLGLASLIQPWQHQDFAALDCGWQHLASRSQPETDMVCQRAYIERPRGHSKTSDMAVQLSWILLAARQPVRGLAAAADRDQANLIHEAIQRLARANPELCGQLEFVQHWVRNPVTQAKLEIISSDVSGSWGALPDFVVCDELCHWEKPDLWYSLLSSAAKKPNCMLTVLTNAGVGRGWQWQVREHARTSPDWYFSSLDGPQAPWITADWLREQQALLPPPVYERLWLNRWQHSDGEFVTLAEAMACRDAALARCESGSSDHEYVAAIDYAEKHDYTVGCVMHRSGDQFIVDRMDVIVPSPAEPTPVAWVENWLLEVARCFPGVRFVLDEYQLLGVIQKYEQQLPLQRFAFHGGEGNHRLAQRLRQLILQRQVRWYPGCGAIETQSAERDDLETELASLLLKQSNSGRVRIDHRRDAGCHDDRAFTLGVCCLELSQNSRQQDFLFVTPPAVSGVFGW
ncbi:MAG: terminase [Planctomycetaceae bacterium]|nr:terminase [Planctomycetaceae bacterium]